MSSARQQLLDMVNQEDCFSHPHDELLPLQMQAARDLFKQRREQVKILDKRAQDTGVGAINRFEDIVPLLFAHTTYKSYPQSYLKNSQWDRMTKWLQTLSVQSLANVDLFGIKDVDDWIDRLWAAGHLVNTTSGTSGKVSVLNRTLADDEFYYTAQKMHTCWPKPVEARPIRHFFMLGPEKGPYLMMINSRNAAKLFGRPDSKHYLTNEPLRISYVTKVAEMRTRMADGSATPQEIADFEKASAEQGARMKNRFDEMVEMIIELRHEPIYLVGPWAQIFTLVERARAKGIPDGDFHPDTVIASGGDLKGAKLPPDWYQQLFQFFSNARRNEGFGMSEMSWAFPRCEMGNHHQVPWIIPLVLDKTREALAGEHKGVIEGRYAFLDLGFEGRWGGLITGDKLTINYTGDCPCGRKSLYIPPAISRYMNLGEEDKIGCAGTIDSYIRGALAA